jgi:hypothetical protein
MRLSAVRSQRRQLVLGYAIVIELVCLALFQVEVRGFVATLAVIGPKLSPSCLTRMYCDFRECSPTQWVSFRIEGPKTFWLCAAFLVNS